MFLNINITTTETISPTLTQEVLNNILIKETFLRLKCLMSMILSPHLTTLIEPNTWSSIWGQQDRELNSLKFNKPKPEILISLSLIVLNALEWLYQELLVVSTIKIIFNLCIWIEGMTRASTNTNIKEEITIMGRNKFTTQVTGILWGEIGALMSITDMTILTIDCHHD